MKKTNEFFNPLLRHDALAVLSYTEEPPPGTSVEGRPVHVDMLMRDGRPKLAAANIPLGEDLYSIPKKHGSEQPRMQHQRHPQNYRTCERDNSQLQY